MTDSPAEYMSLERLITLSIVTVIALASIILMLACASPELTWDEADYAPNTDYSWHFLWHESVYGHNGYGRHGHGPMMLYLAKLGQDTLPADKVSIEVRLRFFIVFVSSLAIGLLYWMLRYSFKTSRSAALVGSGLLLFSVIRLYETTVFSPHHLMLACTLAIIAFGYQWRDRPTLLAALGLGAVVAFGALSMTYVIPITLCWVLAVGLTSKAWFSWDRTGFKTSWPILVMLATAVVITAIVWPPSLRHLAVLRDFWAYLRFPPYATLVGDHFYTVAPRWAFFYWLICLDPAILLFSSTIILLALWSAFRSGNLSSKHAYLTVFLGFLLATMLAAHIAGARNMLQFIGVLCLVTGALFDEALEHRPQRIQLAAGTIIVLAGLNLLWHSRDSSYVPPIGVAGYQAFLKDNASLLTEKSKVMVKGIPILNFYTHQNGISPAWTLTEIPTFPHSDAPPLPNDIQYALMPAFFLDDDMPANQPARRVITEHWKKVWSYKGDHAWELLLFEKPQAAAP